MALADHPKKLALLLLPMIPLTAIGVVEVAGRISQGTEETCTCTTVVNTEKAPMPIPEPVRTERPSPAPPA